MKLLKIKREKKIKNKKIKIKMIILIRNMQIRFFGGDKYSKNISDNTNKIKSKDFGGNKYSKNIIIIYVINDKF